MIYPDNKHVFSTLVDYQEIYTQTLLQAATAVPILITVDHDILSNVSFSSVYGTEVNATPAAGQFRVLYGTNQIEIGPLPSPTSLTITYTCAGDIIYADHVNNVQSAVVDIEDCLGLNPEGTFPTVRDRLDSLAASASITPDNQIFTPDGITQTFILPFTPSYPEAVWVYINGLRALPGTHYTVSGANINLSEAPKSTDTLFVDYFR